MICPGCKYNGKNVMSWKHLVTYHHISVCDPVLLFRELSSSRGEEMLDGTRLSSGDSKMETLEDDRELDWDTSFDKSKESTVLRLYDSYKRIMREINTIKGFISRC